MNARHPARRRFLGRAGALVLMSPLGVLLAACGEKEDWPDGMARIHWDRDTCARCSMVISDRRFAAQARGGPKQAAWKFDDVGCAVLWLAGQAWAQDATTRLWVADSARRDHWLDARAARYVPGKTSPMGYNFAAVDLAGAPPDGTADFTEMSRLVLARGK